MSIFISKNFIGLASSCWHMPLPPLMSDFVICFHVIFLKHQRRHRGKIKNLFFGLKAYFKTDGLINVMVKMTEWCHYDNFVIYRSHKTQHNSTRHYNTQYNNTQHNDIEHNGTQHNNRNATLSKNNSQHNDTQNRSTQHSVSLFWVPLLSVSSYWMSICSMSLFWVSSRWVCQRQFICWNL
jgi:hypothetical protein